MNAVWSWLTQNGIGQNMTAGILWAIAGIAVDRALLRPARKRRDLLLTEAHRLLHHVHADKAHEIGHEVPE